MIVVDEHAEQEFLLLKVKLLFKHYKEGKIALLADKVPETIKAVNSVKFDESGDPILETITAPVRALANAVFANEVDERTRSSPVHEFLGEPTKVDDDALRICAEKGAFTGLAFELYKEAAVVFSVCAHISIGEKDSENAPALSLNQAICAGFLVRIAKFMTGIIQLTASDDRREVIAVLERSIFETAINLRFLLLKNDDSVYKEFVQASLAPERELFDVIQANIQERGHILPIEERMLRSINRACTWADLKIEEISPKFRNWGASTIKERLRALGEESLYLSILRIPSHAVHGTWVDLVFHHLEKKDGGFGPQPAWSRIDARSLCLPCVFVLWAARDYVRSLGMVPEILPLYDRITNLQERIIKVDEAHEKWLTEKRTSSAGP